MTYIDGFVSAVALNRRLFLGRAAAMVGVLAGGPPVFAQSGTAITPFSYRAPDEALADLRRRLEQTRLPENATDPGWQQGPPVESIRSLLEHWRLQHDWRRAEAAINQFAQFRTVIDGLGIHFIDVRSRHAEALPIILTHGWPSTIQLFREVIGPLTDPTAHGGRVEDAFHVVVPSLPGFGFSDKPAEQGWNAERTARAWAVLMERLGHRRYVAQGGDWGAYVTTAMAQQRAKGLLAIHTNFPQVIPDSIPKRLLPDQQRAMAAVEQFKAKYPGYFQTQATRPQTVGYSLTDSPAGLAAWLYDIYDTGAGGTGSPEAVLSRDTILDEITLYWLTGTAASSARFYYEQAQLLGKRNNPGRVELPVAVSAFPKDMPSARSWARQVYPDLMFWNDIERGGHFASLEVPDLFVREMRTFSRVLRTRT